MTRPSGRQASQLRPVSITRQYTKYAEGSVLIEFGDTRVLCNASVEDRVPPFLRGKERGWVTAEYSMLPRATGLRTAREASRGRQSGRTQEIQRLVGRSLRAVVDLSRIPDHTVKIDCDVIQADGGTRTAAITGSFVALADAIRWLQRNEGIGEDALTGQVASVSVGLCAGRPVLDLDYEEDSEASTDMNVVMDQSMRLIELQGTAEGTPFTRAQMNEMMDLAELGIRELLGHQSAALAGGVAT